MLLRKLLRIMLTMILFLIVQSGTADAAKITVDIGPLGICAGPGDFLMVSPGMMGDMRGVAPSTWEIKR